MIKERKPMKTLFTTFLFLIILNLSAQEHSSDIQTLELTDETLIGSWKIDSADIPRMDIYTFQFMSNNKIEIIYHCDGPCEGQSDSTYVDEAGEWTLKEDSIKINLHVNNGNEYVGPGQKILLDVQEFTGDRMIAIWDKRETKHKIYFRKEE